MSRELLQPLSNILDSADQGIAEIPAKFILYALGDLLQTHRSHLRHHAAGLQCVSQLCLRRI